MLKSLFALVGLASIASMVACGSAASEDVGFTGSSEGALLAGTHLTASQVATYVRSAGFPESEVGKMVCIAKYESSFYEKAEHHNSNGSTDYGLFQINSVNLGSHGCAASGTAAYDPTTNARCAKDIYASQGSNAWYAYKSHRSECDSYPAPGSASVSSSAVKGTSSTTTTGGSSTTTTGSGSTSGTSGSMSGTTTTTGSSGSTTTTTGGTTGTTGTTTGTTTTSGDDTTGDDDDDSSGDDSGTSSSDPPAGSCWSQTLGQSIAPDGCVHSAYDGVEEQCVNGAWYSGVSNGEGPDGKCSSEQ